MDQPTETTEQAETTATDQTGPYGNAPLPTEPVVVEPSEPMDEDAVPEPAWVEQQRNEQAEAAQQAEAASAAGSTDDVTEPGSAEPATPTLPALDQLPAPPETRRIALINQKGGVGKTTTTVNLGAALAASGLRVLMIDLDPQAHLTLSLGIDPEELDLSIYDLLTDNDVSAAEVVQIVDGCDRLGVLPADTNLAGIESELGEQIKTGLAQTLLRNKTDELIKQFDYVLIDCPPSLGLLTINGLTCAAEIVVPMQAHFLALQGMGKLFETINMIRQGINPSLTVSGVVLCMHEANTILASDVVTDVEGFFEQAKGTTLPWANAVVYSPPIRRNIKLAEAPSFGQSVLTYANDSNGAKDYARLAKSVATAAV
ncbi:MAG: AAA family ATPase [Phycisphaeraceae bacterium]|nr:AAA family ATPase [Phycisphaeraceae bacterium]